MGAPPINPTSPSQRPGRTHVAEGADDAEPLGGVVEGEADDQHRGQADVPRAGRHADGETLGEVVQADRDCDRQARSQCPRTRGGFLAEELVGAQHVHRAAGDRGQRTQRPQAALDHREASEADGKAAAEECRQTDSVAEAAGVVLEAFHRFLDDPEGVLHDVDEDEGENSDREHGECHAGAVAK